MTGSKVVAVVGSSAGGVEDLRVGLVEPLLDRGYQVPVTLTPTAAGWLDAIGEVDELEKLTGLPVRSVPRLPGSRAPHPRPDVIAVAPATANLVAKLALGIADNQALTMLCENIAVTPMVVFPRVNAAHARQPSWENHLQLLRTVGVDLVYGDDFWPLREPRTSAPSRPLPWSELLRRLDRLLAA
ncbi:flavoprotein [Kribbella sp. ALI-6-A]|uniref:flavoprotein n=1 Tax=Kribbella sp. ALI-6-A TaxID=1933817 RepID=UPI00097BD95E|nr:flavoprotein [Kribbella sp. ALI-6-A]ONI68195.1 flavoprotein [Kribbella sp. ALI-6-A]